ncbi:hypothetical protein [Natronomonas marina]|jgi:peptidoglycan/LPS O-acetylase OafA/YrhL|uniref:hypothetical protein n=1 Tax=Natronomonas marina TaxID=2961939 RepID=UPI0020C941DB|nr:hypothetical protein [Natronomonas marina]
MSVGRTQRRLNAALGVFLLAVAVVVVTLLGDGLLATPVLAGQVLLVALAGGCDLLAAADRPGGWAWYRWSGLGNVLLGLSLPLGVFGTAGGSLYLLLAGVGGLSLALLGVDLLVFAGRYTRGTQLDWRDD